MTDNGMNNIRKPPKRSPMAWEIAKSLETALEQFQSIEDDLKYRKQNAIRSEKPPRFRLPSLGPMVSCPTLARLAHVRAHGRRQALADGALGYSGPMHESIKCHDLIVVREEKYERPDAACAEKMGVGCTIFSDGFTQKLAYEEIGRAGGRAILEKTD